MPIDSDPPLDLRVSVLGRFDVVLADGRPLRLTGRHAQALLALLVLTRRPRSRDAIAADLWPDADGACTGSLRQALWLVRQALTSVGIAPDRLLEIDPETIGVRLDARIDLDLTAFEACLADGGCAVERAVALYQGDLLEGLGHDCFATERERLADRFEDALALVAERALTAGDLAAARLAADRLIARDPLREEAHAVLIAVHGLVGSRSQIVRQYRRLCDVLERELDEAPLPETEAIYRQALSRAMGRSLERAAQIGPIRPPVRARGGSERPTPMVAIAR
jgi:DNA-binding SARP family transcriptional activator